MPETRVLMVRPPFDSAIRPPVLGVPLGLLYLASYLKKHLAEDLRIEVFDAQRKNASPARPEALERKIREFSPGILAISSRHPEHSGAHMTARLAKKAAPGCLVAAGGPYATGEGTRLLRDENIDAAVLGEGEQTLPSSRRTPEPAGKEREP